MLAQEYPLHTLYILLYTLYIYIRARWLSVEENHLALYLFGRFPCRFTISLYF